MGMNTTTEQNSVPALVDVATAAAILGIGVDSVRRRIQRGRLPAIKGKDGQWHICPSDLNSQNGTEHDTTEQADSVPPDVQPIEPPLPSNPSVVWERLVAAKDEEIARLIAQLRPRDDEVRRVHDTLAEERWLIAGLTTRIPELNAAPATEQAEHDMTEQNGTGPRPPAIPAQPEQPGRHWWQVWR